MGVVGSCGAYGMFAFREAPEKKIERPILGPFKLPCLLPKRSARMTPEKNSEIWDLLRDGTWPLEQGTTGGY